MIVHTAGLSSPPVWETSRAPLTLRERVGHTWRTRSLVGLAAAFVDSAGRRLWADDWTRRAPWMAGRLGSRVRTDGLVIEVPTRYLAGVLWLGGFEIYERYEIMKHLPTDLPVVELGAGLGFVSCLANRRLRAREAHICVEANPAAIHFLARNRDRNRCGFRILHAALAYDTATVEIGVDEQIAQTAIGDRSRPMVAVPTVSLDRVLQDTGYRAVTLICDIEGAEQDLFEREGDVIGRSVRTIVMEVHPDVYGMDGTQALWSRCERLGFRCASSHANVWVLHHTGLPRDGGGIS